MQFKSCGQCRHYVPDDKGQQGVCRRNPPTVVVLPQRGPGGAVGVAPVGMWPPVMPNQWCGEYAVALPGINGLMPLPAETDKPN